MTQENNSHHPGKHLEVGTPRTTLGPLDILLGKLNQFLTPPARIQLADLNRVESE
jgi:hypothetical protein